MKWIRNRLLHYAKGKKENKSMGLLRMHIPVSMPDTQIYTIFWLDKRWGIRKEVSLPLCVSWLLKLPEAFHDISTLPSMLLISLPTPARDESFLQYDDICGDLSGQVAIHCIWWCQSDYRQDREKQGPRRRGHQPTLYYLKIIFHSSLPSCTFIKGQVLDSF